MSKKLTNKTLLKMEFSEKVPGIFSKQISPNLSIELKNEGKYYRTLVLIHTPQSAYFSRDLVTQDDLQAFIDSESALVNSRYALS